MAVSISSEKTPSLILALLGITLATFICNLDMSIANVSIPHIASDFGNSINEGVYVITFYFIGEAISVALTGWLSKILGDVYLILYCVFFFVLFSWLCGSSLSLEMLVVSRFFQGLAAGPINPLSLAILLRVSQKKHHGILMAVSSSLFSISWMIGPIIGGLLTTTLSWPWIFYINIPIGLFSLLLIWYTLSSFNLPRQKTSIDYLGVLLMVIAMPCLQLALDKGQEWDWWNSISIRALFATAFIGFSLLIFWEIYHERPFLELRLFKKVTFLIANIFLLLCAWIDLGYTMLYPLWLQQYTSFDSFWGGIALLPFGISAVFAGILYEPLVKFLSILGLTIVTSIIGIGTCAYHIYFTTPDIDLFHMWIPRFFLGFAIVTNLIVLGSLCLQEIEQKDYASAMGLFHFGRALFSAIGIALFVTLWQRRTSYHHNILIENVFPFQPNTNHILGLLEQNSYSHDQAVSHINHLVNVQASFLSLNDCILIMGCLFGVFIPLLYFIRHKNTREVKFTLE